MQGCLYMCRWILIIWRDRMLNTSCIPESMCVHSARLTKVCWSRGSVGGGGPGLGDFLTTDWPWDWTSAQSQHHAPPTTVRQLVGPAPPAFFSLLTALGVFQIADNSHFTPIHILKRSIIEPWWGNALALARAIRCSRQWVPDMWAGCTWVREPRLEAACCCCTDGQSVCLCGTFSPTEPPAYAQTWEGVNSLTDKCCIMTLLRNWYSVRRGSSHVIQSFVEQNERLHVTYQNNDLWSKLLTCVLCKDFLFHSTQPVTLFHRLSGSYTSSGDYSFNSPEAVYISRMESWG